MFSINLAPSTKHAAGSRGLLPSECFRWLSHPAVGVFSLSSECFLCFFLIRPLLAVFVVWDCLISPFVSMFLVFLSGEALLKVFVVRDCLISPHNRQIHEALYTSRPLRCPGCRRSRPMPFVLVWCCISVRRFALPPELTLQ